MQCESGLTPCVAGNGCVERQIGVAAVLMRHGVNCLLCAMVTYVMFNSGAERKSRVPVTRGAGLCERIMREIKVSDAWQGGYAQCNA